MSNEVQVFDIHGVPIAINKTEVFVNPNTGEKVELSPVRRPYYGAKHFWKVYLSDFLAIMGFLDSKQVEVMVYIFMHTSPYNNQFIGTQKAIAEGVGCSLPTVRRTLRKMIDANLITKTATESVYMVNPSILVQGSEAKQMGLLIRYTESSELDVIAEAADMDALPNGQIEMDLFAANNVSVEGEVANDAQNR